MPKRKFDRALLDETLARDNASHDETKELPTRLNRESRIPFTCECGTPDIKAFRVMVDRGGGARCKLCTEHGAKLKRKAAIFQEYGVEHALQSAVLREKSQATLLKNHGVKHPMQSPEIIERTKATMLKNHGVKHAMQSAVFKEKSKATCLEKYDVEYALQSDGVREKSKATMMEKHGVLHPMQSAEVRDKSKKTMVEKHGVEYALQNPEIFEKNRNSAFTRKDYTTPSGQVWSLHGYEPLVAPKLIDEYGEDDITPDPKQVPLVWWTDSKGVRHKYFCDFYVKSHKLVIEVKSLWTETKNADKIVVTREAVNALGYGYRLIVLDGKGVWTRDEFSPSIIGAEGKKPVKE